jgi:hypothetical protein
MSTYVTALAISMYIVIAIIYFPGKENTVCQSVESGQNVLMIGTENILVSIEEDEDDEMKNRTVNKLHCRTQINNFLIYIF